MATNFRGRLRTIRRPAGHALRGSAATSLARRGVSMAVTQRLLGHKTVELTAKQYTRLEVEDVRAAIEGRAGTGAGREAAG
jgi:site-specific recombinase XerD